MDGMVGGRSRLAFVVVPSFALGAVTNPGGPRITVTNPAKRRGWGGSWPAAAATPQGRGGLRIPIKPADVAVPKI